MIQHGWNLGIGVEANKATAKLLSITDINEPCIILHLCLTQRQQFLEQYFQAVAEGGDVASLAAEYDDKINAVING